MILVIFGSLSLLAVNLITAKVLTADDFGKFALLFAFLSALITFGVFGLNQSLMRLLITKKDYVIISPKVFNIFLALMFSVSLVCAGLIRVLYGVLIRFQDAILFSMAFFILLGVFLSTLLRADMRFVRSQIVLQSWKIMVLIVIMIFASNKGMISLSNITIFMAVCAAVSCVFFIKGGVKIQYYDAVHIDFKKLLIEGALFTGITGSLALLNTMDRFVLPKYLDYAVLGNYSVFYTLLVAPFIMLQTGVGYILMPIYRHKYMKGDLSGAVGEIKKLIPMVLGMCVVLAVMIYYFSEYMAGAFYHGKYSVTFTAKMLLLLVGVVRLYYSFTSSIIGGVADAKELISANTIGFISVGIIFIFLLFPGVTVERVCLAMCFGWIIRCVGYTFIALDCVRKGELEEENLEERGL